MDIKAAFSARNFTLAFLCFIPLLFLHYKVPSIGGDGLNVPSNMSTWLGMACFILASSFFVFRKRQLIISKFLLVNIAAFLLLLVPLAYTETRFLILESNRYLAIFGGLLFFIALLQLELQKRDHVILAWSVLIAGVIQAIFGIIQYYFLDENNGYHYDAVVNRPYGSIDQFNVYATVLVLSLATGFYLLKHYIGRNNRLWLVLFFVFIVTIPIIPTQSRTGLFNLIIALSCMVSWLWLCRVDKRYIVLFLTVICAGLFLNKVVTPYDTKDMAQQTVEQNSLQILRTTRVGTRTTIYPVSWALLLEEPIKGHGIGTFRPKYLQKQGEFIKENHVDDNVPAEFFLGHPHNELLLWAIEGGVVALLAILIPPVCIMYMLFRLGRKKSLFLLGLFLPISLHAMVEIPFYISIYLFFFLLSLMAITDTSKKYIVPLKYKSNWLFPLMAVPAFLLTFNFLDQHRVTLANFTKYIFFGRQDISYLLNSPHLECM